MARKGVTGRIGDAEVVLENAAEQAVMEDILKAIQNLGSGTGTGSSTLAGAAGGAATTLLSLDKSGSEVNSTFEKLGKAMGFASVAFNFTSRIVNKAGDAFAGVTKTATGFIDTQPKITDLSKALTKLPGIFGSLGEAVHAVTELLYKNYTTFQQLSTVGIQFGDRLEQMTAYGAAVGVSLDVVAGNLTKQSQNLAMMGSATNGATQAVRAQQEAFEQNSRALLAFGLSYEEQNDSFMRFAGQYAGSIRLQGKSLSSLAGLSGDYAKNLRRLSDITGKSADEAEEGRRQAAMNRSFDLMLKQLPVEQQERLNMVLDRATVGLGEGGRELAMAAMMNMAPVTEASQNLAAIIPGINQQFSSIIGTANTFGGSLEQYGNVVNRQFNSFANGITGFATGTAQYGAMLNQMGISQGLAYDSAANMVLTFGGDISNVANAMKQSPLQLAINEFNEMMQTLRELFSDAFVEIISGPGFKEGLTAFGNFIKDFTDDVKRQGFFNAIIDLFQSLFLEMKRSINESGTIGDFAVTDSSVGPKSEAAYRASIDRQREHEIERMARDAGEGRSIDTGYFRTQNEVEFFRLLFDQYKDTLDSQYNLLATPGGMFSASSLYPNSQFAQDVQAYMDGNMRLGDVTRNLEDRISRANRDPLQGFDASQLPQMMGGTTRAFGSLIHDFGQGTLGVLHNREAVIPEKDLIRMVNGVYNRALADAGAQSTAPMTAVAQSGARSDGFGQKMLDELRDMKLQLRDTINMTNRKLDLVARKQDMTISAVEQA